MYYYKYKSGTTLIEFSNSFSGKETVFANGEVVSEKSSFLGTDHHFTVLENGQSTRYTLRTKIGGDTLVLIDLIREGRVILRDESIPYGSRGQRQSKALKEGLKLLRKYDLDSALEQFTAGLHSDADDAELHFYKACTHSLLEQDKNAFYHLEQAIENGLRERQKILTEDTLAYIRIQEEFILFCEKHGINVKANN